MSDKEDSFHLGVKAIICDNQGRLLLLKLNTEKRKSVKGVWDLPGGRIRKNEPVEQVVRREVQEEMGLNNILRIVPFKTALTTIRIPTQEGDVGLIFATYLCSCSDVSHIQLSEEHVGFDWFEPKEAAELLSINYPAEITEGLLELESILSTRSY